MVVLKKLKSTIFGTALLAVAVTTAATTSAAANEIEVDVELVLAVDVSRSMTPRELEIQRRGYAEALVSEDVVKAIEGGLLGQIALRYVEWAGFGSQRVIVDWTLIQNRLDAEHFAAQLVANFDPSLRRTSISSAIDHSRESFSKNRYTARRQVIDISGDGPNNSGIPVLEAREAALAEGIVINGLPLMTKDGYYSYFNLDDLDEYYRQCVIGGPASFVIPVLTGEISISTVSFLVVLRPPSCYTVPLIQSAASRPSSSYAGVIMPMK